MSEGSVVRCPNLAHALCRVHNVAWLKSRLVQAGVLLEVPGPAQLLGLLEHQFQSWLTENKSD